MSEIGKLAKLPEENYKDYMSTIDKLVKMRRSLDLDLEDTNDIDSSDHHSDVSSETGLDGESWNKLA